MSKDYTVVFPISRECAHQVAMQAALTASAIAQTNYTHPDQVGKVISDAYLQAYEAVEGWTRPLVPVEEPVSTIPHVSLHYGQSVDLFNIPEARLMRVTLKTTGWGWDSNFVGGTQSKDA